MRFHPAGNAGEKGAVPQGHQDRVERFRPAQQLDSDGAGALGDGGIAAVLHQPRAVLSRKGLSLQMGSVEIVAVEPHVSTQGTHAFHFPGIRGLGGEDGDGEPPLPRGEGHALAEVARRRADKMRPPRKRRHQIVRTASLEGADRIERLDFDHEPAIELTAQSLGEKLGRVEEHRIDHGSGRFDAFEGQPGCCAHAAILSSRLAAMLGYEMKATQA
jgi:hypothetical protein